MAAEAGLHADALPGADTRNAIFSAFIEACNSTISQFNRGIIAPTVSLVDISVFGSKGIAAWKSHVEVATNTEFQLIANILCNVVTLIPAARLTSVMGDASTAKTKVENLKDASAIESTTDKTPAKIPRPPNAFILYRLDWHSKIVAQHPNMRNNEISQVIGKKWAAESNEVKDRYRLKAQVAKDEHALKNPGYQYKPRKPSEKRKRMTKTKATKLQAQVDSHTELNDVGGLDQTLKMIANGIQVPVEQVGSVPYENGPTALHQTPNNPNALELNIGDDIDPELLNAVNEFNATHPWLYDIQMPYESTGNITTLLADGQNLEEITQYPVDYDASRITVPVTEDETNMASVNTTAETTPVASVDVQIAEISRQERLEKERSQWFDIDSYTAS